MVLGEVASQRNILCKGRLLARSGTSTAAAAMQSYGTNTGTMEPARLLVPASAANLIFSYAIA